MVTILSAPKVYKLTRNIETKFLMEFSWNITGYIKKKGLEEKSIQNTLKQGAIFNFNFHPVIFAVFKITSSHKFFLLLQFVKYFLMHVWKQKWHSQNWEILQNISKNPASVWFYFVCFPAYWYLLLIVTAIVIFIHNDVFLSPFQLCIYYYSTKERQ